MQELASKRREVSSLQLLINAKEEIFTIKLRVDELLLADKIEQMQQMIGALNAPIYNMQLSLQKINSYNSEGNGSICR